MKQYEKGIDFVIISYTLPELVKQCVRSIDLYFKKIPKTIHIVCNYLDYEKEVSALNEMFTEDYIKIHKGIDQSESAVISDNSFSHNKTKIGKLDNNKTAMGSYYGAWATNIGIDAGNREHVCIVDQDSIFLDTCAKDLIKLSEQYCFISNRWDPGTLFKEANDREPHLGMARPMMFFSKRKFYDDIASEAYVEKGIWSSSPFNVDWRDNCGNLTWYAQQKNKEFLILPNTYWCESRRKRYNINEADTKEWHRSKDDHILPLKNMDNEQCWIDDKPIHFHLGRGGHNSNSNRIEDWIQITNSYFTMQEYKNLNGI
jgi:hypothetical protein